MENSINIIKHFEMEQLENFNNNEAVKMLENLCLALGLEFKTKVEYLENFNLAECRKRKLVHSGYLVFEILHNGKVIEINNDDYGLLTWADAISELKENGKYKLFKWNSDSELIEEVIKMTNFLQSFRSKNDLIIYVGKGNN